MIIDGFNLTTTLMDGSDYVIGGLKGAKLTIITELGLSLPAAEWVLPVENHAVAEAVGQGKKFTITLSSVESSWTVSHMVYRNGSLTVVALLDKLEWINQRQQASSEETSLKALANLINSLSLHFVDGDIDTNDQQVWLKPNISDRDMSRQVFGHAASASPLIFWCDLNGRLNVTTTELRTGATPVVMGGEGNRSFENFAMESRPFHTTNISQNIGVSSTTGVRNEYGLLTSAPNYSRILIDCGNSYKGYRQQAASNSLAVTELHAALWSIDTYPTADNVVAVGDTLTFAQTLETQQNSMTSGTFIVARSDLMLDQNNTTQRLLLLKLGE